MKKKCSALVEGYIYAQYEIGLHLNFFYRSHSNTSNDRSKPIIVENMLVYNQMLKIY